MRHALVFGVQTTGRVSATANDVRLPPLSGPCTVLLPSFIADRWRIHLHLSLPRCVLRAWRKKKKKKKKQRWNRVEHPDSPHSNSIVSEFAFRSRLHRASDAIRCTFRGGANACDDGGEVEIFVIVVTFPSFQLNVFLNGLEYLFRRKGM